MVFLLLLNFISFSLSFRSWKSPSRRKGAIRETSERLTPAAFQKTRSLVSMLEYNRRRSSTRGNPLREASPSFTGRLLGRCREILELQSPFLIQTPWSLLEPTHSGCSTHHTFGLPLVMGYLKHVEAVPPVSLECWRISQPRTQSLQTIRFRTPQRDRT